eukprot:5289329-Heterocapsa_arctica.AAC.1
MSRARGIRLPGGAPGPQPLRFEALPLGLPGLGVKDSARVTTANALIYFTLECVRLCVIANIHWAIENPERSLLWWVQAIVDLLPLGFDVLYD